MLSESLSAPEVVLISGNTSVETALDALRGGPPDRRKATAAGFQAHVTKPVVPAKLVTEIARLAGRTNGN